MAPQRAEPHDGQPARDDGDVGALGRVLRRSPLGPYGRIARFVLAHRPSVGAALLALCVVCAWIGLPPKVEPNLMALLPDDEPSAQALRALHAEEGGVNLLTIAVQSDDPARTAAAIDDLQARFEASPDVRWALHDVDPVLAQRIGLLRLEPASVQELSARVQGAVLLGPAMNSMMAQRLLDLGPMAEGIRSAGRLNVFPDASPGSAKLLVKPTGSSMDPPFALRFMDEVDQHLAAVRAAHPGVEIPWVGGAYRHNVEDMRGIQDDMVWTGGASLALVFAVIVVAFRSWRAPLLVLTPLIGANVVNLALVAVFIGSLNTYTSFGTALLFGLGIDFAIHLVGRAREERAAGRSLDDAIVAAWDLTGPPSMTAALTSAAGFLALAIADFKGFSQLGMLLASGLMLCFGAMLIGLPVLMPWLEPADAPPLRGTRARPHSERSSYALAPAGLLGALLATALVAVTVLPRLDWEYDFSALRRDGLAYDELSEAERALARESYSPVVVSFDDDAARDAAAAHVRGMIDAAELPHVRRVLSVADVLPPDQPSRLAALQALQGHLRHPNARYLPPPLLEQLAPLRDADLRPLSRDDLPPALLDVLVASRPDSHRLLLVPTGNMWDLREAAALELEIRRAVGDAPAAGEYVTMGALFRHIQADLPKVMGLAFGLVALLCAIDLRRPHWVLTAVGTLVAGMIWSGAALVLLDVRLTVMNIVGVPILLGIGVDVVVHLLHRLADEGPGGVRRALSTTGVAATLSTLTTVFSFGSLALAGSRGVRSMGLLVAVGLCTIFLATTILLPTAWAAGFKLTGRAPRDATPQRP
jgi:predicted RND superfamily exporter protein